MYVTILFAGGRQWPQPHKPVGGRAPLDVNPLIEAEILIPNLIYVEIN